MEGYQKESIIGKLDSIFAALDHPDQIEPRLTSEDTVQTTSLHRFNQFLHKYWKWVL